MTDDTATQVDFPTPEPVDLKIELNRGTIDVTAADTTTTSVELVAEHGDSYAQELVTNARVEQHGRRISVVLPKGKGSLFGRSGEVRATIVVPVDSSLSAVTGSADLTGHGRLGDVGVRTGSGDVALEHIASGDVAVGSGDVEIDRIAGLLRVKSGSGDIAVGPIGGSGDIASGSGDVTVAEVTESIKIKTGSGDIDVKSAGGRVSVLAGSGNLLLRRVDRGEVTAKTGSGDVSIGIARGTAAYLDVHTVTGEVTSQLDSTESPADDDLRVSVNVRTGTGDVVLQHA